MKKFRKFYFVRGMVFEECNPRKSYIYAKHYADLKGYSEKEIYELRNDSELNFLKELLKRGEEIEHLSTHKQVKLIKQFTNSAGIDIQDYVFDISFFFFDRGTCEIRSVLVVDSVYELNRELKLNKTLFDYLGKESGQRLEVYYYQNGVLKEWQIGDNDYFIQERKEQHKKFLAQRRAIRDSQKYDRLLKLRREGKITERQSKELYRLEKVFGGK